MTKEATHQELERVWEEHTRKEFVEKDVEVTLATMTDDASVNIVPLNIGGRGKESVKVFYRDVLIASVPDDMEATRISRTIADNRLVDELRFSFTHNKRMDWILPNVPPTFKKISLDHVVVVEFRGDKISAERVYWDQAGVLRQAGWQKE